jgi:4-hydroxybenzoate polyprenyltransferase
MVAMAVQYGYRTWDGILADWREVLFGASTLVGVQVASNWVNLSTDTLEDSYTRRFRPTITGHLSSESLSSLGHILWVVCVLRAATINAAFGVLVACIVLTSYAYSTPPIRLKKILLMGNVAVAAARGLLGVLAAWTLVAPVWAPQPWAVGLVLFTYLLGAITSKDFNDEAGDRAAGSQTLVVRYGPVAAAWISLPFCVSPLATIPLLDLYGYLDVDMWAYVAASVIVLWFCRSMIFQRDRANRLLEATKAWSRNYLALFALMLMFGVPGFLRLAA